MENLSREVVVKFLYGIYSRAVEEDSGVAYYLSPEQLEVLEKGDIQKVEDETGYSTRRSRVRSSDAERVPFRADMR